MLNLRDFMKRLDENVSSGVQYGQVVSGTPVVNNIESSTDEYQGDPDLMRLLYTVDENGHPFSIPGLTKDSPTYVKEYVAFMRLKENDPVAFQRILNWE